MARDTVAEEGPGSKSFAYIALLSAGLHVILVVLKYSLGMFSGSIALKADAFHSLADVLSSLTVYAGIKISERKSTAFPYGLYKVENLAALITSIFIFFAAYEIVKEVIHAGSAPTISHIPIAVLGLVVIVVLIFLFSRYEIRAGRRIGSPSLVADGQHLRTDLLSTGGILAGLLVSLWGWNVDRYIAVIIVLLILRLGWRILVDSLKVLLDASIDSETLDRVRGIFYSFPPVKYVIRLSGRRSGRYTFIDAEVILDVETLQNAHDLSSAIEEEVYDSFPEIDRILIHYEPPAKQESECQSTRSA